MAVEGKEIPVSQFKLRLPTCSRSSTPANVVSMQTSRFRRPMNPLRALRNAAVVKQIYTQNECFNYCNATAVDPSERPSDVASTSGNYRQQLLRP